MTLIYKILKAVEWDAAVAEGVFRGSAVDLKDGYIHFSAAHQLRETARRHFAGEADLVLVALAAADMGPELRWEKSRGGNLFPHLYGALDPGKARSVVPLLWRDGAHEFPADIPQ